LGCPIGEFVARREPMLFITGVDSVVKTIKKVQTFLVEENFEVLTLLEGKTTLRKQTASV